MKLIIDISDESYKKFKTPRTVGLTEAFDQRATLIRAIQNGTPVSTDGDLISRKALKRAACVKFYTTPYYKHILDLIDNAPAIAINCKDCDGYEAGYSAGLNDAERTKGEWIKVKEEIMSVDTVAIYKCSKCERVIATLPSKLAKYYPFCHCGADMRKGDVENG